MADEWMFPILALAFLVGLVLTDRFLKWKDRH